MMVCNHVGKHSLVNVTKAREPSRVREGDINAHADMGEKKTRESLHGFDQNINTFAMRPPAEEKNACWSFRSRRRLVGGEVNSKRSLEKAGTVEAAVKEAPHGMF